MNALKKITKEIEDEEEKLLEAAIKALDIVSYGKDEVFIGCLRYCKRGGRWFIPGYNSETELADHIEAVAQSILKHVDKEYDNLHDRKTNLMCLRKGLEERVIE